MNIISLKVKSLEIPFKISFKHNTADRSSTQSILVTAQSKNGNKGYGEGCPRTYVTSEDIDTSILFFKKHKESIQKITSLGDLKIWMNNKEKDIDNNPAAWCAIELALLDLLGKEENKTIEELLCLPKLDGDFQYTAVLGSSKLENFVLQMNQYKQIGFNDFKMKLSGDFEDDFQKIYFFNQSNNTNSTIRVDANNLWNTSSETIDYMKKLNFTCFAIEEPIQINQYEELSTIANGLETKIILDESFLRKEQFQYLNQNPIHWIINIRISKMGGILRSLDIAKEASSLNIRIIIGAQVGETSILTRAALCVANNHKQNLVAQEGAFGTHLLKNDLIKEALMFGKKGILSINSFSHISRVGLGITQEIEGKT